MTGGGEELSAMMISAQRTEEHGEGREGGDEYLGEEPSMCQVPGVRAPGDIERQWSPEGLGWSV